MNYVAMKRNNENDLRIFQLNEKKVIHRGPFFISQGFNEKR